METLTDLLLKSKYRNQFVTSDMINRLLEGSSARRWGLVNRALKKSELIKLRRGLYTLDPAIAGTVISRFSIANRMVPESYITQETALGYYGWLQEEPVLIQSGIGSGRRREYLNTFGEFVYERIPVSEADFLKGVDRVALSGSHVLIASRERALCDTVNNRGLKWKGIVGLCEELRTDVSNLYRLNQQILKELSRIYKFKNTRLVLSKLLYALGGEM